MQKEKKNPLGNKFNHLYPPSSVRLISGPIAIQQKTGLYPDAHGVAQLTPGNYHEYRLGYDVE